MSSQELILVVDGDAERSDTVLLRPDGTVLNHVAGGPANPNEIGIRQMTANLQAMFDRILTDYGGREAPLLSVYAGFAGGWVGENKKRYYAILHDLLPHAANLDNSSDAINALTAGIGQEDGISLVAGTGSIALVRCGGAINQVGGWGYLLGDEGSSFDMGRLGLRYALMAIDGRGEMTSLVSRFAYFIGKPVVQAVPDIYAGGKRFISALAPLVIEAADDGDPIAASILDACTSQLAQLLQTGSRYLNAAPYQVVITSAIWDASSVMRGKLSQHLDDRFNLIRPELPPIYGAALEAVYLLGEEPQPDFKMNFSRSIRRYISHE